MNRSDALPWRQNVDDDHAEELRSLLHRQNNETNLSCAATAQLLLSDVPRGWVRRGERLTERLRDDVVASQRSRHCMEEEQRDDCYDLLLDRVVTVEPAPTSGYDVCAATTRNQEEDWIASLGMGNDFDSLSHVSSSICSESSIIPLKSCRPFSGSERVIGVEDVFAAILLDGRYDEALRLLLKHPGLGRKETTMICQGERTHVYPLHMAVADPSPSMELVDALVTTYPTALMKRDSVGSRTPLQIALWKCPRSINVIRFLVSALPISLEQADGQGNLPLHTAAFYSQPNDVLEFLLERNPSACRHENDRGKLPIHVYCGRGWVQNTSTSMNVSASNVAAIGILSKLIKAYPECVHRADREGRLPLHIACSDPQPCWEVLAALMDAFPGALLVQTKSKKTPLQLLRQMTAAPGSLQENHVVLAMVSDRTTKERRRRGLKRGVGKLFRRQNSASVDLYNCYG